MRSPTVTIIICARNAASHLRRSIPAALAQDYPAIRFKVLVVDNGSSDGTGTLARKLGAKVIRYAKPGIAGAREFGWRTSKSELVAYLDADCEPPPDWLSRMVEPFTKDPKLAAAGARLVPGSITTLAERHIVESRLLDTDRFWERNALSWPFLVTAGMVVRRKALESIDGFDLSFGRCTGEDADLCWRLRSEGWSVEYLREVKVIHHHRATLPAMLKQVHWYGRSSTLLFSKWRSELGWWRYTDKPPYWRLIRALFVWPFALLKQDRYQRVRPALEVLDSLAFLSGKLRESTRKRVLFL